MEDSAPVDSLTALSAADGLPRPVSDGDRSGDSVATTIRAGHLADDGWGKWTWSRGLGLCVSAVPAWAVWLILVVFVLASATSLSPRDLMCAAGLMMTSCHDGD